MRSPSQSTTGDEFVTVIAVLVDPPRDGFVAGDLAETSPLTEAEAATLYAAMVKDTIRAVTASGGDLLVNYRSDDDIPESYHGDVSAEAEVRTLVNEAIDDPDDVRFEVQVGSTFAARAGNTATHLLREEDAQYVAIVDAMTPLLTRQILDSAAMKLRTSEVVLGPAERGRVYYLGLTDPIDFDGAYDPPELESLAERGAEANHGIDFLPTLTKVETGPDLVSLVAALNARQTAGRTVPRLTAEVVDTLGLRIAVADGDRKIGR